MLLASGLSWATAGTAPATASANVTTKPGVRISGLRGTGPEAIIGKPGGRRKSETSPLLSGRNQACATTVIPGSSNSALGTLLIDSEASMAMISAMRIRAGSRSRLAASSSAAPASNSEQSAVMGSQGSSDDRRLSQGRGNKTVKPAYEP